MIFDVISRKKLDSYRTLGLGIGDKNTKSQDSAFTLTLSRVVIFFIKSLGDKNAFMAIWPK